MLLNFFIIFLKKISHGNENLNKKHFLLKYSADLEKMYQDRVTMFKKECFLAKFIFDQNFLFKKRENILMKQFFFQHT